MKNTIVVQRKTEDRRVCTEFITEEKHSPGQCFLCLGFYKEMIKVQINKSMVFPWRVCLLCAEALGRCTKIERSKKVPKNRSLVINRIDWTQYWGTVCLNCDEQVNSSSIKFLTTEINRSNSRLHIDLAFCKTCLQSFNQIDRTDVISLVANLLERVKSELTGEIEILRFPE